MESRSATIPPHHREGYALPSAAVAAAVEKLIIHFKFIPLAAASLYYPGPIRQFISFLVGEALSAVWLLCTAWCVCVWMLVFVRVRNEILRDFGGVFMCELSECGTFAGLCSHSFGRSLDCVCIWCSCCLSVVFPCCVMCKHIQHMHTFNIKRALCEPPQKRSASTTRRLSLTRRHTQRTAHTKTLA